jgi:hypothetical protein
MGETSNGETLNGHFIVYIAHIMFVNAAKQFCKFYIQKKQAHQKSHCRFLGSVLKQLVFSLTLKKKVANSSKTSLIFPIMT